MKKGFVFFDVKKIGACVQSVLALGISLIQSSAIFFHIPYPAPKSRMLQLVAASVLTQNRVR